MEEHSPAEEKFFHYQQALMDARRETQRDHGIMSDQPNIPERASTSKHFRIAQALCLSAFVFLTLHTKVQVHSPIWPHRVLSSGFVRTQI